jgi:hypothetical protein
VLPRAAGSGGKGVTRTNSRTTLVLVGGVVITALCLGALKARRRQSPAAASSGARASVASLETPDSPQPVSPNPVNDRGVPAKADPCGCADILELQERIREAKAVIPLYQAEIDRIQANVPVPSYSSQRYSQFQSTLIPVLDGLAMQNGVGTFADGDTSMFCKVTPDPRATACMKASTMTHEGIHRAVCEQYGWSLSAGTWKQQIGLIAVYQNEIAAYQAELDFLEPLLASLTPSCFVGWRGRISSTFTTSTIQTSPMQSMKLGLQSTGSTTTSGRSQIDHWTFNGLLGQIPQITRGAWSGTVNSGHSLVEDSAFQLADKCAGKVLLGHMDIKETAAGSGSGRADLMITLAGAVAHVSVLSNQNDPPGKITSSRVQQGWGDIIQNDCGHRVSSGSPRPMEGPSEPFTQSGVDFDAPVDPEHPEV